MKTFIVILTLLVVPSIGLASEKFNLLRTEPVQAKPERPPIIETHITNDNAKERTVTPDPEPKATVVAAPRTRKSNDGGPDWQWDENRRVWWRTLPVSTYSYAEPRPVVSQPVFRGFRSYSIRSGSC